MNVAIAPSPKQALTNVEAISVKFPVIFAVIGTTGGITMSLAHGQSEQNLKIF